MLALSLSIRLFLRKKEGTTKRPHRITLKDQGLFGFAGLWDTGSHQRESLLIHARLSQQRPIN